jgi:hypothetical protein
MIYQMEDKRSFDRIGVIRPDQELKREVSTRQQYAPNLNDFMENPVIGNHHTTSDFSSNYWYWSIAHNTARLDLDLCPFSSSPSHTSRIFPSSRNNPQVGIGPSRFHKRRMGMEA